MLVPFSLSLAQLIYNFPFINFYDQHRCAYIQSDVTRLFSLTGDSAQLYNVQWKIVTHQRENGQNHKTGTSYEPVV